LRAVAVYLVVAFHSGIGAFSGGFIGVDVFFVLSGYLVTQLLLRDFRTVGRIDFRRFYSRRFRRLLPAAFVTLIVTAIVYTAVAAPADVHDAIGGFRAAFLYVANWHFIAQSNDYFAADVNANPVVHFWSLAVEEQFYLAWPLLLTGTYLLCRRAGPRQWKLLRLVIAAGFLISLGAALHLSTVNLSRAYYGTDTRAYELFAGALLALTPWIIRTARPHRQVVQALAPVALAVLVLIATSTIHLGAIQRGLAATLATTALIIALETATGGIVHRLLSTPTAVYLGKVSYGTYLWHWPVIVILTLRYTPNPASTFAITCLLGTALASLSYELLEQRVRLSHLLDRHRTAVIAIGLTTSIIAGVVIIPNIMRHNENAANATAILGTTNSKNDLREPVPPIDIVAVKAHTYGNRSCYRKPVTRCIVVRGSGTRILLVGDSIAVGMIPAFAELSRRHGFGLAIAAYPGCPWLHEVVEVSVGTPPDTLQTCRARQADWYERVVPEFDPDVIVLVHRTFDDPGGEVELEASGKPLHPGTPGYRDAVRRVARETVNELAADGRKVVIIEPPPLAADEFNPANCLSEAEFVDDCRYVAAKTTPLEEYYRSIANGSDVFTLDLDRLVCPYFPICDPIVNGVVVKRDKQHITAAYSETLGEPIESVLAADGVLPRSP